MKNTLITAGLYVLAILGTSAQSAGYNIPHSFLINQVNQNIPTEVFTTPNVDALLTDDIEREKQGVFYRTGVFMNPKQELTTSEGKWISNVDGTVSWFIQLSAKDAKALGVYFDYFSIPEQGKLYVYNQQKTHVVGPYTSENSVSGDAFATAPVIGDLVTLEYNGPAESADDFKININEVAYMYRNAGFGPKDASEFGDSDPCEVNANCSEGASWGPQRRSVVKIIVRDGSGAGLCSGSMLNSTNNDCTPYVLTANHCGGGASVANFKQWVFYFNFETPGCTNPASATDLDDQTVTGCLKMANSGDISDVVASDFLLVHLKNRPAASFNAFMAGWNRGSITATSGVGIHHPAGDVKKISTYILPLISSSWGGGNTGKHWAVRWSGTANGFGVTEGGSSGSPIFDQSGLVVGDLSGGSSFCTNTSGQDSYGKFVYSWDQTSTTANRRLKDWLDKANLNPTTMVGKEISTCTAATLPVVDFIANNTTPSVGETVTLTNQSTGTALGYEWQITPATFAFVNGTTYTSENPQVQFSATTSYTVTLNVFNQAGYNLKTRSAYIKPHSTASIEENVAIHPTLFPNPSNGNFQVRTSENPIERIEILDMNGKMVYRWTGKKMEVSINNENFAKGVYLLKVESGKLTTVDKLIIN